MNFAFPALFILLLVLPGIILRYFYFRGSWAESPFTITSFADEVGYGIAFALPFHMLWMTLASWWGHPADLRAAFMLLIGSYGSNQAHLDHIIDSVTAHPVNVCSYFLTLYVAAAVAGWAAHTVVRWRGWDRSIPLLRFHNEWYYLLSGEAATFREYEDIERRNGLSGVGAVYLTAVVEQGSIPYLYRGIVKGFYFDRDGSLDRVVLILAHRRRLDNDRAPDQRHSVRHDTRYYEIAGDLLVLRYVEIKTLNLEYIPERDASGATVWLLPHDLFGGLDWPDSGDNADDLPREPDQP